MSEETEEVLWLLEEALDAVDVLDAVCPASCAEDTVAIIWANRAAKVSFAEPVAWVELLPFNAVV
jgi:hypothetical protein